MEESEDLGNSFGYLCDVCSEIFSLESELRNHVFDDHFLDNYVFTEESADVSEVLVTENESESEDSVEDIYNEDYIINTNIVDCVEETVVANNNEVEESDVCLPDVQEYRPEPADEDALPDIPDYRDDAEDVVEARDDPGAKGKYSVENLSINEYVELHSVMLKPVSGNHSGESNPGKKKRGRPQHPPRLYYCEHCDYKSKIKNCMRSHILTHTLDCPFCPFKTIPIRQNHLTRHINTHHLDQQGAVKTTFIETRDEFHWSRKEFLIVDISNKADPGASAELGPEFSYLHQYQSSSRPSIIMSRSSSEVKLVQSAHSYLTNIVVV